MTENLTLPEPQQQPNRYNLSTQAGRNKALADLAIAREKIDDAIGPKSRLEHVSPYAGVPTHEDPRFNDESWAFDGTSNAGAQPHPTQAPLETLPAIHDGRHDQAA